MFADSFALLDGWVLYEKKNRAARKSRADGAEVRWVPRQPLFGEVAVYLLGEKLTLPTREANQMAAMKPALIHIG